MGNKKIFNISKRLFIALWLGFLFVLCVCLVMSSLSGSMFQEKLTSIARKTNNHDYPFAEHDCISDSARAALSNDMHVIKIICLSKQYEKPHSVYGINEIINGYNNWSKASKIDILKYTTANSSEKNKQENELNEKIKEQEEKIIDLKKGSNNTLSDENSDEIDFTMGDLNVNISTLSVLRQFKENQDLLPLYAEIQSFNDFFKPITTILRWVTFGTLADHAWTYPVPILKLNLVLSMGIFGSLIFVTIEFISEPKGYLRHSFVMYFFRPFLGMIVALAMYVLVKSGQFALFSNTKSDLSPFLISFLGIISGMLADQAYKQIHSTGITFLTRNKDGENKETNQDGN